MTREAVKFSSKIDPKVLKDLREFSKVSGRSMTVILTDAVREHLERSQVRPAFRDAMEQVIQDHGELLSRLAR